MHNIFPPFQEFTELDQKVQDGVKAYLQERGINAELGGYIMDLSSDKEQREYVHWLEKFSNFVSK